MYVPWLTLLSVNPGHSILGDSNYYLKLGGWCASQVMYVPWSTPESPFKDSLGCPSALYHWVRPTLLRGYTAIHY